MLCKNPKGLIRKFDVIGTRGEQSPNITHASVADEDCPANVDSSVAVSHCRPPFLSGSDLYGKTSLHVAGRVVNLTDDEKQILQLKCREIQSQMAAQPPGWKGIDHYSIKPTIARTIDPDTGVLVNLRFSCVGYVLYLYQSIDINLLEESETLPEVDVNYLLEEYPFLQISKFREKLPNLGLKGNGPWKILLAGYLLKSLDRDDSEIRRTPFPVVSLQDAVL